MFISLGRTVCFFVLCLFFIPLISCAKRPYLVVDYKIVAESDRLTGKLLRVQVKDLRLNPSIFTPAAAVKFPGFEDRYRLSRANPDNEKTLSDELDLEGLFYEAFAMRLQKMGVEIVPQDRDDAPLFQILINTLKIDLRDHKWVTSVSFEGNLSVDNQLVARETVSGEAERVKIVGTKGADDNFSDIFTEITNRLNIGKLFSQAKM